MKKEQKIATLADVERQIAAFNNTPGVGFDPRMIVMDFTSFQSVAEEIMAKEGTRFDPVRGIMFIKGIQVVSDSQMLRVKP